MTRLKAESTLLAVTLVWGGTFAVIKLALDEVSPSLFVLSRFVIALAIGSLIWPQAWKSIDKPLLRKGLLLGVMFGIGFLLQSIGLTETSASTSAFITGTMVVFVPFVFKLVEKAPIKPLHIASVIAVMIGLWLFTRPEIVGVNAGDVLTLISAVLWAFYVVYIDVWTKEISEEPNKLNALVLLQFVSTIGIAAVGVGLLDHNASPFDVNLTLPVILGIAYCAILASVFTTWAQTRFQQYVHPVRAGVIFAMEPLFASLIAWWALSENWDLRQGIGAAFLLGAIVIPDIILARKERA